MGDGVEMQNLDRMDGWWDRTDRESIYHGSYCYYYCYNRYSCWMLDATTQGRPNTGGSMLGIPQVQRCR